MRIDTRTRGLPNDKVARERVAHRLRFALGRFTTKVSRVYVTLEDTNGSKGGVDKRCKLRVVLTNGGPAILAEDMDSDILVAIDRASLRLSRNVARVVNRAGRPSRVRVAM